LIQVHAHLVHGCLHVWVHLLLLHHGVSQSEVLLFLLNLHLLHHVLVELVEHDLLLHLLTLGLVRRGQNLLHLLVSAGLLPILAHALVVQLQSVEQFWRAVRKFLGRGRNLLLNEVGGARTAR
jgi:hypothetical protein